MIPACHGRRLNDEFIQYSNIRPINNMQLLCEMYRQNRAIISFHDRAIISSHGIELCLHDVQEQSNQPERLN